MHTSFDSLFEVNLTYCTRVLPLKEVWKNIVRYFLSISKTRNSSNHFPNLSNQAFNYIFTVKVFI